MSEQRGPSTQEDVASQHTKRPDYKTRNVDCNTTYVHMYCQTVSLASFYASTLDFAPKLAAKSPSSEIDPHWPLSTSPLQCQRSHRQRLCADNAVKKLLCELPANGSAWHSPACAEMFPLTRTRMRPPCNSLLFLVATRSSTHEAPLAGKFGCSLDDGCLHSLLQCIRSARSTATQRQVAHVLTDIQRQMELKAPPHCTQDGCADNVEQLCPWRCSPTAANEADKVSQHTAQFGCVTQGHQIQNKPNNTSCRFPNVSHQPPRKDMAKANS